MTLARTDIADELRAAAGDDALLDAAAARAFAGSVRDPVVVAPGSADAVARVLAYCSRRRIPVRAAGAGTWLHGALPLPRAAAGTAAAAAAAGRDTVSAAGDPDAGRPAIIVTTARLAAIHEYEPADLTAGVGAGTPLDALRARLARHGQWLALDPPALPGATVGATIALGAAGPLRHAFGTPRDAVLGVEVATGDGRLLRFGGRVVKNVAGYDVVRLLVGSRGALGVITAAHVRLRPLSDEDATWRVPLPEPSIAFVEPIARALEPAAMEWVDGVLLVRVQGNAALLEAAAARFERLTGALRLAAADAESVWTGLGRTEAEAPLCARLSARPASLPALLAAAAALRAAIGEASPVVVAAHAAEGIARVLVGAHADWAALRSHLVALRREVAALGGSVRFEPLPAALADVPAFEPQGAAARLGEAIRAHFDPAGILP